jgi:hypothetical protein
VLAACVGPSALDRFTRDALAGDSLHPDDLGYSRVAGTVPLAWIR